MTKKHTSINPNEPVFKRNGLEWTKTFHKMAWEDAIKFCQELVYAGHSDWRLPTIQELFDVVDYDRHSPATDLPDTKSCGYWSATSYASNTDYAWHVDFHNGYVDGSYKSNSYYVRAVRKDSCNEAA